MRSFASLCLILLVPQGVQAMGSGGICLANDTWDRMFLVAESDGGPRVAEWVDPGGKICSPTSGPAKGVVSVFPNADVVEGCSRLVGKDQTERILRYDDIDRCSWATLN